MGKARPCPDLGKAGPCPLDMLLFPKLWLNIICNSVGTLKKQSHLKISFVSFCSVIFLMAEFFICYHAFTFIRDFPGVGSILSERLMYLFYLSLFLMLIFSNAVITYSITYRSKDTELLFTYPIAPSSIFRYKFFESVVLSSWAFLVLLIPFMVSFGIANNADMHFYPSLILFFIPFLIVAGSIGSFFTMCLARIMPGKKLRGIIIFIGFTVAFCIYFAMKKIRIEETSQTLEIFMLNKMLPNIRVSHSPFWPSYWMAEGILRATRGEFREAFFYFLLLLSSALFFTEVLIGIASRLYLDSWVEIRSHIKEKSFLLRRGIIEKLRPLFCIFGRDICGLITKDMKLFWRDASQWSQFLIFFGLLGVYFLNIRNFSYNLLVPFWKNICAVLNLSATLLTLGSLGTRFIFPQISMEGNKFWIIGLAPIGLKKVLYQKFWTSVVISLFITETLIITSNRMLGIDGIMMYASCWAVFIMNFALVGLSVGLGAAFPDFSSENPARIVSGFGGTLTLMLNIGFILITALLIALPFQLSLKGYIATYADLKKAVFFSTGLISLMGLGLCIAPLLYGEKRLRAAEF